jgi:hypothetical protein
MWEPRRLTTLWASTAFTGVALPFILLFICITRIRGSNTSYSLVNFLFHEIQAFVLLVQGVRRTKYFKAVALRYFIYALFIVSLRKIYDISGADFVLFFRLSDPVRTEGGWILLYIYIYISLATLQQIRYELYVGPQESYA